MYKPKITRTTWLIDSGGMVDESGAGAAVIGSSFVGVIV